MRVCNRKTVGSHLKLYLNLLVYDPNIFGCSWKVFGKLWLSSEILGIFPKMFGSVRVATDDFEESLEIFLKY